MSNWARYITLLTLLHALGCGQPAPPPETAETTGAEVSSEPPPPPPPARLRLVHASPEPEAQSLQLSVDGAEPVLRDTTMHAGSAYAELTPGVRMLSVSPTGADVAATLAFAESPELLSGRHYTAIAHGLAHAEPPMALSIVEERDESPPEGHASVRVFHAIAGVDALDVCIAGASPRDPATVVHPNVAYGTFGSTLEGASYEELPAQGELVLQLRARHATPCRGRLLGVARTALSAGENHLLVLLGRTTGRPRVDRELVICVETHDGSCIAMPITSR